MARITQFLAQILCRPLYRLYFGLEVRGRENIKDAPRAVLIVSNHNGLNDAWLVGSSFPLWRFLPIRYMAGTNFYWPLSFVYRIGIIPFIYWFFGALALPHEGTFEEKIAPAVDALQRGQAVVIFPEGKRVFEDDVSEFKRGASEVYVRAKVPVVPVAMRMHGKKMVLGIDKPFQPIGSTAEEVNREMHSVVRALYMSL